MEVKNPMMDQLLVNTAAPSPAGQSAKAPKDADRSDFDSMVSQKRASGQKPDPRAAKPAGRDTKEPKAAGTDAPQAQEQEVVSDGQYAIAAALMFQAQPDLRVAQAQAETVEAVPEPVVEEAQPEAAQIGMELPQTQDAQALTAEPAAEVAAQAQAVGQAQSEDTTVQDAQTDRPVEQAGDRPVAAEPETREVKAEDAPAARTAEQNVPQAQNRQETRAEEKTAETPRFVRSDRPAEAEEDANDGTQAAQAQQAAPLFTRVDAQPVKVAEVARPIPLAEPDGAQQLGSEIGDVLVNSADANRIEITLTPEHLGKLTVEISRGENGALSIVLHPSTERAANLLERHTVNLQNALMNSARDNVEVQVRPSEQSQQQFLNPDGHNREQQQQQQQQGKHRDTQQSAEDFLQQLRLGLVDNDGNEQ